MVARNQRFATTLREWRDGPHVRFRVRRRATFTRVHCYLECTNQPGDRHWLWMRDLYEVRVRPKGTISVDADRDQNLSRDTADRFVLDLAALRLNSEDLYRRRRRSAA